MNKQDSERIANVYKDISEHPATTVSGIKNRIGTKNAVEWSINELTSRGLIVPLENTPGIHSVENRYSTIRAAGLKPKKKK